MPRKGNRENVYNVKHVALFSLKEILPKVGKEDLTFTIDGVVYTVSTATNERYKVFRRAPYCNACGLRASHFVLCIEPSNPLPKYRQPYLRMYAETGAMFTVDHIKPRAVGGTNDSSNLQTMCASCNRRKGSQEGWRYYIDRSILRWRMKNPKRYVDMEKLRAHQRRKLMEREGRGLGCDNQRMPEE